MSGKRRRLCHDPFHNVAVADQRVGVVIHNVEIRTVEIRGEVRFRQRHAHCRRRALTKWSGGSFNTRRQMIFRVSGGDTSPLAEILDLVEGYIISGQVE